MENGQALGGYRAVAVKIALATSVTILPEQLHKTRTRHRDTELFLFAPTTGTNVFSADPHSPWQRPSNGNINGLPRQYFLNRSHAYQQASESAWLKDISGGLRRSTTIASAFSCCIDWLNPPSSGRDGSSRSSSTTI